MLIIWKHYTIRKRHWFLTLTELMIPITLFAFMAYSRSKIHGLNKINVTTPTLNEFYEEEIIFSHFPSSEIQLWYAPYSTSNEKLIRVVQQKFQMTAEDIRSFGTEEDLLQQYKKNSEQRIAGVIFHGDDIRHLDYSISLPEKYLDWETQKLYNDNENLSGTSQYIYKGFVGLQIAIDLAFMELVKGEEPKVEISLEEFPYPPHVKDSGLTKLYLEFLPLLTVLSFIFVCPSVLHKIVEEKSSGIKEFLKMSGMNPSKIWLGWLIHALSINIICVTVIVVLMKIPLWGATYSSIEHCDAFVLFTFLFLYCLAAVSLCFLISTLFSAASIAMTAGILIWLCSYIVPKEVLEGLESCGFHIHPYFKLASAFIPNMALHHGYSAILVYETREVGVQWNNLLEPGSGSESDLTMGIVMIMLIIDTVLFLLLTIYIDNINPGEFGLGKRMHFPLADLVKLVEKTMRISPRAKNSTPESGGLFDEEKGLKKDIAIQITRLKKMYGKQAALNDLTFDVKKFGITLLLGHNGAGKSTAMSIITGVTKATSGKVEINGKDIRKDLDEVRKSMGMCPQHNLLFPNFTVEEHLEFFSKMKAVKDYKNKNKEILEQFELTSKKHKLVHTLSGGMKRKLCLAIAMIGKPEVLVLDEPTSGMDPESRRKTWDLLLAIRKYTTILLTTHFMDEAEALADYVILMKEGSLFDQGTPNQLKEKHATVSRLKLMVDEEKLPQVKKAVQLSNGTEFSRSDSNVVFNLPISEKKHFQSTFHELEKLGIDTMDLNVTTLNDVFYQTRDERVENGIRRNSKISRDSQSSALSENPTNSHTFKKIWALLLKRYNFMKRRFSSYLPGYSVGLFMLVCTMFLSQCMSLFITNSEQSLNLTLSTYGKTEVLFESELPGIAEYFESITVLQNSFTKKVENVSSAIIDEGVENIEFYKKHLVAAADFHYNEEEILVNAKYSLHALHSAPISINLAMNALTKTLLGSEYSISTMNLPLKNMDHGSAMEICESRAIIFWLILLPTGILYLMTNAIIFPFAEISTDFVRTQIMAGVSEFVYWICNIIYDLLGFLLIIASYIAVVYCIDWGAFKSPNYNLDEFGFISFMIFMFVFSSLPFTYLFAYGKSVIECFAWFITMGMFMGFIPTVGINALTVSGAENLNEIADILTKILLVISPHYSFSYWSLKFSKKYVGNFNWEHMDSNKRKYICDTNPNPCCNGDGSACSDYKSYFHDQYLYIFLTMLSALLYFSILMCLHIKWRMQSRKLITWLKHFIVKVKSQQNHPTSGNFSVVKLFKSYNKTRKAVKDLSLTLKKNSCHGLLGTNGAGKTSTFRMLTKAITADRGDIQLRDENENWIPVASSKFSEKLGYSPQENALNLHLTGNEILTTIALLRGYSGGQSKEITEELLKKSGLEKYKDIPCSEYSGGNKRKLCTCIALIGTPKIVLLDEPTTGVDPISQRDFWGLISTLKQNKSVLLCSHSMEECEAICDEIHIMKLGSIKKEGNLISLKKQSELGYLVTFVLESSGNEEFDEIIDEELPVGISLVDQHKNTLTYRIKNSEKRLSKVFKWATDWSSKMEYKYQCNVDFTIKSASLEDVFMQIAKDNYIVTFTSTNKKTIDNIDQKIDNDNYISVIEKHKHKLICSFDRFKKQLSDVFEWADGLKHEIPKIDKFEIACGDAIMRITKTGFIVMISLQSSKNHTSHTIKHLNEMFELAEKLKIRENDNKSKEEVNVLIEKSTEEVNVFIEKSNSTNITFSLKDSKGKNVDNFNTQIKQRFKDISFINKNKAKISYRINDPEKSLREIFEWACEVKSDFSDIVNFDINCSIVHEMCGNN